MKRHSKKIIKNWLKKNKEVINSEVAAIQIYNEYSWDSLPYNEEDISNYIDKLWNKRNLLTGKNLSKKINLDDFFSDKSRQPTTTVNIVHANRGVDLADGINKRPTYTILYGNTVRVGEPISNISLEYDEETGEDVEVYNSDILSERSSLIDGIIYGITHAIMNCKGLPVNNNVVINIQCDRFDFGSVSSYEEAKDLVIKTTQHLGWSIRLFTSNMNEEDSLELSNLLGIIDFQNEQ